MGRPASHRPSFKAWSDRTYRRAVSGDIEFGRVCPLCAGLKSDQALRCRRCKADAQVTHGNRRRGMTVGYTGARIVQYHGPGT